MQEITVRTIKEPDFSKNFEILHLDELLATKKMEEGMHRHDFFFLLILEKAKGLHKIDFVDFSVASNTIFFIRPGQVHELLLEPKTKGFLLSFSSNFYVPKNYSKEVFQHIIQQNSYVLTKEQMENLLSVSKNIYEEFTKKEEGYLEVIKANLDVFYIQLKRFTQKTDSIEKQNNSYEQLLLEKFLLLLENQIFTKKQVNEYAEILNITAYKLNSITKKLLGKTSSQLIKEQIVLEAKRLLLATSNQVNEIAFQLGYDDPAYFIRFFKKQTEFTPKIFRENFK
ncbi:helix-turn-helix domain-containing protein [Aureivirga marina]|uniref:helix-turn-helix domain-containing protein n=1 Tax=Aureivirga marina TaxID=1182451 RepID=UPI0018C9F2D5|nr:helix-turn-helix domain-containing protein [Aureivirga marina]